MLKAAKRSKYTTPSILPFLYMCDDNRRRTDTTCTVETGNEDIVRMEYYGSVNGKKMECS